MVLNGNGGEWWWVVVNKMMVLVVEVTVVMLVAMVSTVHSRWRPQHARVTEDLIKFPNLEMLTLVGRLKVKWISRWEPEIRERSRQVHDGSLC